MTLAEFVTMWQEDGTRLVERRRREIDGYLWLLYAVYFPQMTSEYGRHMAMILKVRVSDQAILMHDLTNIQGEWPENWTQYVSEWWERHCGRY